MGAAKELIAIHGRIKARVAGMEKALEEYSAALKEHMKLLDQAADAIDLAEDESESPNKSVGERQKKFDGVLDKQTAKLVEAAKDHLGAASKISAFSKIMADYFDDAVTQVKKIEVKVK